MTYQPPQPNTKTITLSPSQILRLARLFTAEDMARDEGYPYALYKAAYGLRAYHPSSFDSDSDLLSVASTCERALMAIDAIMENKPEDDDPFNPMSWLDGDTTTFRLKAEATKHDNGDVVIEADGISSIVAPIDETTLDMVRRDGFARYAPTIPEKSK